MQPYVVVLRNAAGRERTERVVASTANSASTQAILRVTRETGAPKGEWQVVSASEFEPVL